MAVNKDRVILLISEEDASDTYYELSSIYIPMLNNIHDRMFIFGTFGIQCTEKYQTTWKTKTVIDEELINFIQKFRHGKFTDKWNNVAKMLEIINITDEHPRCIIHDYFTFFTH